MLDLHFNFYFSLFCRIVTLIQEKQKRDVCVCLYHPSKEEDDDNVHGESDDDAALH